MQPDLDGDDCAAGLAAPWSVEPAPILERCAYAEFPLAAPWIYRARLSTHLKFGG